MKFFRLLVHWNPSTQLFLPQVRTASAEYTNNARVFPLLMCIENRMKLFQAPQGL